MATAEAAAMRAKVPRAVKAAMAAEGLIKAA